MGLFSGISKTEVQKRYEKISESAPIILSSEVARCKMMFDALWSGLTMAQAQEVIDLFGTNAKELFLYHSAWQTFLKTVDSNYTWLTPPFNVTINEDGTVTLVEKMTP